jgi:hypothetical protein
LQEECKKLIYFVLNKLTILTTISIIITMSSQVAYFSDKRGITKEEIISIDGMDSMAIYSVQSRNNGIRPWEKARFEANARKNKQNEYFERQKQVNKMKNTSGEPNKKEQQEAEKKRADDERIALEKRRREIENPIMGGYEGSGNDAW